MVPLAPGTENGPKQPKTGPKRRKTAPKPLWTLLTGSNPPSMSKDAPMEFPFWVLGAPYRGRAHCKDLAVFRRDGSKTGPKRAKNTKKGIYPVLDAVLGATLAEQI